MQDSIGFMYYGLIRKETTSQDILEIVAMLRISTSFGLAIQEFLTLNCQCGYIYTH